MVDKEVHTFPKGIWLKVNVMRRLEFELAYYNVVILHISHSASGIPPMDFRISVNDFQLDIFQFTNITFESNILWYSHKTILQETM